MKRTHSIYALKRKDTGQIFYVGRSVNPEGRWNTHCKHAIDGTHSNEALGNELRKQLGSRNVEFVVIDSLFGTDYQAETLELHYIHAAKEQGHPLLNKRYDRWRPKGNAPSGRASAKYGGVEPDASAFERKRQMPRPVAFVVLTTRFIALALSVLVDLLSVRPIHK